MASTSPVRSSFLSCFAWYLATTHACRSRAPAPGPPRRLRQLARHHDMRALPATFSSLIFYCTKKVASHNAQLSTVYIFFIQITASTNNTYTHQQQVRYCLFAWQASTTTSHHPCMQSIHHPSSLSCKWYNYH